MFSYSQHYWYVVLLHPLSFAGMIVMLKTTFWNGLGGNNVTNFIGALLILLCLLLGLLYTIVEIVSSTPISIRVEHAGLICLFAFKREIQITFNEINSVDLTYDRAFYDFEIRYNGGVLRGSKRLNNLHELIKKILDEHPECVLKD